MMNPEEYCNKIFDLLRRHHNWFRNCIPLIASENVMSPAAKEALVSDFGHRYAEGWPGERVYAGCTYIDQVEETAIELAKKLFKADFADVRPISGVVANLVVYTAFTRPGDKMFALAITKGGHISMGPLYSTTGSFIGGTAGAVRGLNVKYFAFNEKEMNIDVDKSIDLIKQEKPRLIMFGGSVFLFPHPVKEFVDVANEVDARIAYDAAHVAGLIAGGCFQDPLREGAEAVSMSTHKTLPGPQHGMVVAKAEHSEEIKKASFPGLLSNHHLHCVAALAVTLAEHLKFGEEYSKQIIRNAKKLGEALYERGFKVVAAEKGFTESHTILVDISEYGDGATIEKELEKANIILNRNLLPWDIRLGRHYTAPGGIRLGTSEVTRLGMKESEMESVADYIRKVVIDKRKPEEVAKEVEEFREGYQKIHYCFETAREAYEYLHLR